MKNNFKNKIIILVIFAVSAGMQISASVHKNALKAQASLPERYSNLTFELMNIVDKHKIHKSDLTDEISKIIPDNIPIYSFDGLAFKDAITIDNISFQRPGYKDALTFLSLLPKHLPSEYSTSNLLKLISYSIYKFRKNDFIELDYSYTTFKNLKVEKNTLTVWVASKVLAERYLDTNPLEGLLGQNSRGNSSPTTSARTTTHTYIAENPNAHAIFEDDLKELLQWQFYYKEMSSGKMSNSINKCVSNLSIFIKIIENDFESLKQSSLMDINDFNINNIIHSFHVDLFEYVMRTKALIEGLLEALRYTRDLCIFEDDVIYKSKNLSIELFSNYYDDIYPHKYLIEKTLDKEIFTKEYFKTQWY